MARTQTQQKQPGRQSAMRHVSQIDNPHYKAAGKLKNKVALITGGDSGIGAAVAIAFAKEGAKIAIVYLNEHEDAEATKTLIEKYGSECYLMSGDVGDEQFCQEVVTDVVDRFGALDIVVNNAGEQHTEQNFEEITSDQIEQTFATNIFSQMYMVQAALPYFSRGASIINTASVTAYAGNPMLIDYSSTKGAIVSFTRSLSLSLAEKGIRVNAVAPGPIWTPLIESTFPKSKLKEFGKHVPMKRAGQPYELAAAYVFLASDDSTYVTGQIIHVNGGEIVNG